MNGIATIDEAAAPQVTPGRILETVWNFAPPILLDAAIQNRVFDVLEAGPMTREQIAAATGASPRGLRALLNALTALQFLERQDERYALTPESSAFLVNSKPAYLGGYVRHIKQMLIPSWLPLGEIVRAGRPDRSKMREDEGPEYFRQLVEDLFAPNYPAACVLADRVAKSLPIRNDRGLVKALDIAAGAAVWGIALAKRMPNLQVTAVDWPAVMPAARKAAKRHGVLDRFNCVEGDMFEVDFGQGHCIATLGHVLHCESEPRNRQLLRKTFDALAPGGTIAIAEFNPNEDRTGPAQALMFAVNMLVHTDEGDAYTFGQISGWLREAGFVDSRQLPAPAPSPLILATKPPQ